MADIKVADEVWIATALLHREHPARGAFRVREILARVDGERVHPRRREGVATHVSQHSVANKPPAGGGYRMLLETPDGGRRLFRLGDPAHEARRGKITPKEGDIPPAYRHLLTWYREVYDGPQGAEWHVAVPAVALPRAVHEALAPYAAGWQAHIALDEAVLAGKPVIRGTRLAVEFVVELLALGWSIEDVAHGYPGVTPEAVRACLSYATAVLQAERVYHHSVA